MAVKKDIVGSTGFPISYAQSPMDYTLGILVGKNAFRYNTPQMRNFTMSPMGINVPFPVYYQGMQNGNPVDEGIAYPGEDFKVYGDEVREYPILNPKQMKFQQGGKMSDQDIARLIGQKVDAARMYPQRIGPGMRDRKSRRYLYMRGNLPRDIDPESRSKATKPAIKRAKDIAIKRESDSQTRKERNKSLQRRLKAAGLYKGEIDGILGRQTGEAVKALQRKYNLDVDGIIGQNTMAVLDRVSPKTGNYPTNQEDIAEFKKGGSTNKYQDGSFLGITPSTAQVEEPIESQVLRSNILSYDPITGRTISPNRVPAQSLPQSTTMSDSVSSSLVDSFYDRGTVDRDWTNAGRPYDNIGEIRNKTRRRDRDPYSYGFDPYKINATDIPWGSTAYNLGMVLRGPDRESPYYNEYAPEALSALRNLKYTPNYRPLRLSQNRFERNLRDRVTSPQQMSALLQNAQVQLMNQIGDTDLQAANINNQYRAQYAQALSQEGRDRAAQRKYARDRNLKHKAAHRQHLAALAQGADNIMKQRRTLEQARIQDEMRLAGINAESPDYHIAFGPRHRNILNYYRDPESREWMPMRRKIPGYAG